MSNRRITAGDFLANRGYDVQSTTAPGGLLWCVTKGGQTCLDWSRWWDLEGFAQTLGWHENYVA